MKILVTVGTTPFDSLIRHVDENFDMRKRDITMQIAEGAYIPRNFPYIRFSDNIKMSYAESDIVITHAGAGTVYTLLEMEKKTIIVPNLDRIDKHQMELARFMQENQYAIVCYDLTGLTGAVEHIDTYHLGNFEKEPFFAHGHIKELIEKLYK